MTNKTPILLKRNNTSGLAPTAQEMVPGELALNTTDGTIYTKKEDGTVIALASAADLPLPTSVPWTSVTGKPALAAQVHTHQPSDIIGTAVVSNDPRLTDNRDPNPHTHDWDGEDITNKPPINNDGERWYFHPSAQSGVVDIASYSDNYYVRVSEGGAGQTTGTKIKGPVTLIDGPTPASLKFADNTTQTTAYTGLVSHTHPTSEINGLDTTIGEIQSDISNLETGKQDSGDYALASHNHSRSNNVTAIGFNAALNNPIAINPDNLSSIGTTAVGFGACEANSTGYQNTGVGNVALLLNTTGYFNSGIGGLSMQYNTTGIHNTGIGSCSLRNQTTSQSNTGCGFATGYNTTTGSYNTTLGAFALFANTVGSNNIAIGYNANSNNTNYNNCIIIGANATAFRSNDFVLGSTTNPIAVSTSVGSAGTASDLPSSPLGYLEIRLNGTLVKIPYYRA
jgi:hypothetical protein